MLKQRKRFLVIPLIIIFFIILTTSPQKSVHFKSSLLWVFKIPLTITSHIGNSFFKISRAIQGLTDYERACNEIDTLRFKLVENEEIREVVKAISDRGWQNAVIFLLEMGQPLALLGGQLLWILQPALSLFISADAVSRTARLLEQPDAVNDLINQLDSVES